MFSPDQPASVPQDFTAAQWTPSEAIYAFAAWLTAREDLLGFEPSAETASLFALAVVFSQQHALPDTRRGYEIAIVPYTRPTPSPEEAPNG